MKFKFIFTGIFSMVLIAGCGHQGHAHNGEDHSADHVTREEGSGSKMEHGGMMDHQEKTKGVEVGNNICPVSGDEIPAPGEESAMGEVVKYEYKGKIYNLCCTMCAKDFKKDPEKYSKIAEEEMRKFQERGKNEEHKEGDGHAHHNHGK